MCKRIQLVASAMQGGALWTTILTLLVCGGPAAACEGHAYLKAELDPLPAALSGVHIEVHKTMGAQLVIENTTARTVEILDEAGVPFVRIGPRGVEGNVAARAWYLTYSPGVVVPAAATHGDTPRWMPTSAAPTFGWFESRVDTAHVPLAPDVIAAGRPSDVGRWEIPLRVDGTPVMLAGRFRYEPPEGIYSSRLTSAPEIAPGVRVTLLPGRVPGLLLQSSDPRTVMVRGIDGEPFLRIGPLGVEANLRSPTWWQSARGASRSAPVTSPAAPPEWQRVAHTPRFSWVEPRAAYPHPAPPSTVVRGGGAAEVLQWRVPIELGDEPEEVTGVVTWKPVEQRSQDQRAAQPHHRLVSR